MEASTGTFEYLIYVVSGHETIVPTGTIVAQCMSPQTLTRNLLSKSSKFPVVLLLMLTELNKSWIWLNVLKDGVLMGQHWEFL